MITIDAVQFDGDIAFHIPLKDCLLSKTDFSNPIMGTKFLVNFIGELLVRENIKLFASIITELDAALYHKMVCTCYHKDFGMSINQKQSVMTFLMHISLVQEILTEEFTKITGDQLFQNDACNDFDESRVNDPGTDKPENIN